MKKRLSFLAGQWYPKNKSQCEKQILDFKNNARIIEDWNLNYRIGVVPHAGWIYSGRIANNVIYNMSLKNQPELVILIGGHLGSNDKIYFMDECAVETPFGDISCNSDYNCELLKNLPAIMEDPDSYEPDNTTELQLPFIKYYFPESKIFICRIPPNDSAFDFALNLDNLIKKKYINCSIVCSTDLTHYGFRFGFTPAGTGAQALDWVKIINDKEIIDYALNIDGRAVLISALSKHNSCCGGAIAAGVELARLSSCKYGKLIDYYTSADAANEKSPSDFVGYAE